MYFFTRIHPTTAHSQRAKRTAGCGFWECKSKDAPIRHESEVIGYRLQFTFRITKGKRKTNWIMHEFRLPETSKFDGLVLCRIHIKTNKKNEEGADTDDMGDILDVSDARGGVQEKVEEEGRLEKRRKIEESGRRKGLVADDFETSSNNASLLTSSSSFLPETPGLLPCEEPEVLFLGSSDVACFSIHAGEQEETATEGRLEQRKQVEEPNQQLGVLADNNDTNEANNRASLFNAVEEFLFADDSSPQDVEFSASAFLAEILNEEPENAACLAIPVAEQEETTREERLKKRNQIEEDIQQGIIAVNSKIECSRDDTTEASSQASKFNDDFPRLEDLICLDDFPPLDEYQFNASSSFSLDHPSEDNPNI